jgi:quercetin dioxygenase-like cupin family protein
VAGPIPWQRPTMTQNPSGAVVRPADAADRHDIPAGTGASMQVLLGEADGTPHFAMRRFRFEEGGGMPYHTNEVEHEQYVLAGRARIRIADEVHEVGPGDVLYIPARVPHAYQVTDGPFEFLCLVPNEPDRIEILEE